MSVKFYWLQARYLEKQGVLDKLSRRLAEDILAVDSNNPQVLEMLAVAAISEGDAALAITMLNRTLNSEQRPERIQATVDALGALRSAYARQGRPLLVLRLTWPCSAATTKPPRGLFLYWPVPLVAACLTPLCVGQAGSCPFCNAG